MINSSPDIAIIGSGIGGATLAASLAETGKSIVILERGTSLSFSKECRDDNVIFGGDFFKSDETWLDGKGKSFQPSNYYNVGGNSKFFGAVMLRYRAEDFVKMQHIGGISPAWPISYAEFEPWYQQAEQLYQVRGDANQDPSEPEHSGAYSYSPIEDEPTIATLRRRLEKQGLKPSSLPLAVDLDKWLKHGKQPWDGFPNVDQGKMDAETVGIKAALKHQNVSLITNAKVVKLLTDDNAKVGEIIYEKDGRTHSIKPKITALCAGAVNSAALLLRSANQEFPTGLANGSDMVGRNFMNHNCSAVMAIYPFAKNNSVYQKTLQMNDFYLQGGTDNLPLGNAQLLGKISGNILAVQTLLPQFAANWVANHSVDWYAMSEDLPNHESRVSLVNEKIKLKWERSNWQAHLDLVKKLKTILRKAGYPIVISKAFDRRTPSHQCGTLRFGHDPKTSVLNIFCQAHQHKNLFVVDASFLPNSAAVNPALTIAAQALRVANYIKEKEFTT